MTGETHTVISKDGTSIAYTRLGRGPAVVLVDGAFCYRENGPAPTLAPLLAEHFTVYAYDRRGRGASGDAPQYAIEREVDDLRAVVDAAGGSARALGMSSGSGIVLRAAASGVGLNRVALYEPPFIHDGGTPRDLGAAAEHLRELAALDRRQEAVTFFMTHVFGAPRFFVHGMRYVMRSAWRKNESVAHTLPYDLTILNDRSILAEAGSITVPTLVIGGAKSPASLRQAVEIVSGSVPRSRATFLDGQNHNVSMTVLAPVLVRFFQES